MKDESYYIPLTQGMIALVDADDYPHLIKNKWCYNQGYAVRKPKGKGGLILMHREIMQPPDDMEVDHINHDGCDNRRENLRICTGLQNRRNRSKVKRVTSSQYKGVSKAKNRKKWAAHITRNGIDYYLGTYDNEIDAAKAFDKAAIEYSREFADTNFEVQ